MKRQSAVALAALLACHSGPGYCGQQTDGAVVGLLPSQASFSFIASGVRSSPPACATATDYWAIDVSTPQGEALSASVITAFAAGKAINVYGTGACSSSAPDRETVLYVLVKQP